MYADDVTILFSSEALKATYQTMITEITHVEEWLKLNRLSMYVRKTKDNLFHT